MFQVINFQAHVRNREVKNLMIHNKTNQVWLLKPVIDGEYWTGADTITIDPQTGKNYEIAFRPLTMTVEHKRLMNDLGEELKRYEAAVNGSIFVEQF